jgi:serine/threonine protein kinase
VEKIYFGKNDTLRTRNGQYLIDSVTESGNAIMARGHNTNDGQRVIIKRYQPWKDGSEKMIQRELKALQKIKDKKHKGVVELVDFSEDKPTLVLEDLGEIELGKVVKEKKLKPKTAMRITREILKTAEFLAGNGIFHRDIKPENILV